MAIESLQLADWRERVARLYLSDSDLIGFREARDRLFASHPQSPLPAEERNTFTGLRYFPESADAVTVAPLRPASGEIEVDTGGPDGVVRYERIAVAQTVYGPLTLWWIQAYGGGLFVPFRDTTSPKDSYGGGRYLTDTVKGTYGRGLVPLPDGQVRLDFNYAYNPSCAYDSRWACPLAPAENRVAAAIPAGEMNWH